MVGLGEMVELLLCVNMWLGNFTYRVFSDFRSEIAVIEKILKHAYT